MKQPLRGALCAVLFAAGVFAASTAASAIEEVGGLDKTDKTDEEAGAPETDRIVARVNGSAIHESLVKPELDVLLARFRKYGRGRQDAALVARQKLRVIERLIGQELLRQVSDRVEIEGLDGRVKSELANLKAKHGTEARFEKFLETRGLSIEQLEESLRSKLRVAEYLKQQGVSGVPVPDARVREFYDKYPERYTEEETVQVSHILIAVEADATEDAVESARKKADRIRKEILDGGDFTELAKKHSQCNSAEGGGNLRYIQRGYMPEEFDRVAFGLEKGAVSEVVRTKFGFHVIRLNDRKPGGVAPYEDVRPLLAKFVQQEEDKKRLKEHIAKLRAEAEVEILVDD